MHKIQKIEIEISKSYEIKNVVIVYYLDVYFGLTAEKNENGRVRKQKLKERPKKVFSSCQSFLTSNQIGDDRLFRHKHQTALCYFHL